MLNIERDWSTNNQAKLACIFQLLDVLLVIRFCKLDSAKSYKYNHYRQRNDNAINDKEEPVDHPSYIDPLFPVLLFRFFLPPLCLKQPDKLDHITG